MKKQPRAETNAARIVTVLSVSPAEEDHSSLQEFFSHSKWELYKADGLASARVALRRQEIGVVICGRDLSPGTWIDMLEELRLLRDAPPLIVAAHLADDRLWAEALNLGAYDVLTKPFDHQELVRSVSLAWLHWRHQAKAPARLTNTMRVAS